MSEWIPPLVYGTWDFMRMPVNAPRTEPRRPTLNEILAAVAWFYKVSAPNMRSERRDFQHAHARQIYFLLAREMTVSSLAMIGREAGGRDHKTVLSGLRSAEKRAAADERLRDELDVLRLHIKDVAESRKPFGEVAA